MNRFIRIPVLASLILASASLALADSSLKVGSPAPALKVVKWVKGKPIKSFEKGKVYVVEFWATWCGPCKTSIPHITEMAKKYKGKAEFIGVSVWEPASEKEPQSQEYYNKKVEAFVKDFGAKMDYNVCIDDMDTNTMGESWMRAAEQGGIPSAFVVDQSGNIAWIGHPMGGLDKVVGEVINGTFDAEAEALRAAKAKADAAKRMEATKPAMAAMKEQKYAEAIAEFDKLFASDPSFEMQFGMAKLTAMFHAQNAGAADYARALAKKYGNNPNALNSMAWMLVDDKSTIKNPDYKLAIELAQLGVDNSKAGDPMLAYVLDTLAYAHFKAGNIDKAIATQERALAAATATKDFDKDTLKEITDRLAMFKTKKG